MTYCLGIMLDDGLVFAADSRTNAGVDNVSTFRKLHVFENPGERLIAVLSAGNLATSQSVVTQLDEGVEGDPEKTLYSVPSMYEAAKLVGRAAQCAQAVTGGDSPAAADTDFTATFVVGGQIAGRRMRLFQVYAAGNFIEATEDTPYLQIGETKYGKPILQRVLRGDMGLVEAAKCALVSLDSTIQSNVSVAPPLDVLIYEKDTMCTATRQRINENDTYFQMISEQWAEGLRRLYEQLPNPDWNIDVSGRS